MTQTAHEILTTVGYDGFVRALFNRSGHPSKDFTHAVLGIVTEINEYRNARDLVNAIEEAGDLMFYLVALEQVLSGITPIDSESAEFDNALCDAAARMGDTMQFVLLDEMVVWLDLAKRWVGYGKAPTMSTTQLLAEASALVGYVLEGGIAWDTTTEVVVITNVEKLLKRYNGMQFNAERAVNRDLPAERAALEEHAVKA